MDAELFYIFDIAEDLAEPLNKWFQPIPARLVSQMVSFALNAAIWTVSVGASLHVITRLFI